MRGIYKKEQTNRKTKKTIPGVFRWIRFHDAGEGHDGCEQAPACHDQIGEQVVVPPKTFPGEEPTDSRCYYATRTPSGGNQPERLSLVRLFADFGQEALQHANVTV
jgi:hypothetical protein